MSLSVAVKVEEKKNSSGENDEVSNMSISEGESPVPGKKIPEKKTVTYQYTRDELMGIKGHPLSKIRPDCLDPAFNNSRGVWDPERWHQDCKRSETPPEDDRGGRGDALLLDHKRRSGDPRERLRKEQDGIVLSPQRRSFNSGCCVTLQLARRPDSPLGKNDRDMGHREIPSRRIGSGRIPTRDMWDFRETDPPPDFLFRAPGGRDREERRSFGRDFERDRERERDRDRVKDRHRGNRDDRSNYDRRRAHSDSHEEEPEWFSGGPTSQHDTIELRGFEDIPEEPTGSRENKRQNQNKSAKNSRSGSKKSSEPSTHNSNSNATNNSGALHGGPGGRSTPTSGSVSLPMGVPPSPIRDEDGKSMKDSVSTKSPTSINENSSWQEKGEKSDQSDFNLEDFLKGDSIPGLLTNGATVEGPAGSRFSQWFRRESPIHQEDSRRSSLQDELLSNIIGDIVIPLSESNTYFAPISPAANTAASSTGGGVGGGNSGGGGGSSDAVTDVGARENSVGKPIQLLDLLQRRGQGDAGLLPVMKGHSIRDLEAAGKVHSVEELEAKMRQGLATNNANAAVNKKNDEDLSAFNKLLAQVSDGKAIPASVPNGPLPAKPQPLNFLQMLSKSQQDAVGSMPSVPRQAAAARPSAEMSIPPLSLLSGFGALGQQPGLATPVPPGLGQATAQQHSPHPQQQQQMQIPQDLVMKLLQVQQQQQHQQRQQQQQQQQQQHQQQQQQQQQEILSKLLAAGQQSVQSSRLGPMGPQFSMPPPPSLSPLPPELQVMVANAQPSRELLQRPEAKALLQGLRYGEITPQHLVQQLQNPAMQHRHREVLVSILKMQMQQGASPRTVSPHPHAQQPDLLHQIMLQQQQQQHQQQQLRIPSPLNSGLPHRVPSPRELIVHTQNIMQSALIKKKLEEQRENYRRRQEMQQSLSPNIPGSGTSGGSTSNNANNNGGSNSGGKMEASSPVKHLSSPTPLAFTPTSVLRKMTAEKESESTATMNTGTRSEKNPSGEQKPLSAQTLQQQAQQQQFNQLHHQQPLRQQSGHSARSQQQSAVSWNMPKQLQQGRAIVKGNTFQYGSNTDFQQQQQQQPQPPQQPRHGSLMSGSGTYSNNMPRSKVTMATPPPNVTNIPQQFNSLMMMHHRPPVSQTPNTRSQNLQAQLASLQQHQQQQQRQQNQQGNMTPSLQQLLMNQNFTSGGRSVGKSDTRVQRGSQPMAVRQGQNVSMGSKDLSTSPTTNQLARWFSRAGQLPDMPPIPSTQNILSLEELERHQQSSAAVHN